MLNCTRFSKARGIRNVARRCRAVVVSCQMAKPAQRPRVLVSNDDGIEASGLLALVAALAPEHDVFVCAPSGERSAQSHAITVGRKYVSVEPRAVPGALDAYAVGGTPADCVMMGQHGPIFKGAQSWDLVVSGINRGENCGLHVIYSGTVGAAREAACKGVPALALSFDHPGARAQADYLGCAAVSAALVRATLLSLRAPAVRAALSHTVLNINFPRALLAPEAAHGLYLTWQGCQCILPSFTEVTEPGEPIVPTGQDLGSADGGAGRRWFSNTGAKQQADTRQGSDSWALHNGWVSVTPLQLTSDVQLPPAAAWQSQQNSKAEAARLAGLAEQAGAVHRATADILQQAGQLLGLAVGGIATTQQEPTTVMAVTM